MSTLVEAADRPAWATFADLVRLTKPRITMEVLFTTAGGMWLAGRGHLGAARILLTLLGTALVVSGANTLNMYLERDIDGRMERTRNRPLPTGRIAPVVALAMGLCLGLTAIPLLTAFVNPLTGALAAASLLLYVAVYTPLKQRSSIALLVGAVPGAIPPLMGWTAARGALEAPGLILFAILFLWEVPHFLAITLYRTDDYAGAGFKVLAVEKGPRAARLRIVIYLGVLLPVTLLLVPLGVTGGIYRYAAPALGAALLAFGVYGLRADADRRWARQLFLATLVYLSLLFAAIGLDAALGT